MKFSSLIITLSIPLGLSFTLLATEDHKTYLYKIPREIHPKFTSDAVQHDGYSLGLSSYSRKESALVKVGLLSLLPKSRKETLIIANHQLQYITSGLGIENVFNLWMGNYGITEISDFVAYLDQYNPEILPSKVLITSITSPNNDLGQSITGYREELPDNVVGKSKNPFVNQFSVFAMGSFFDELHIMRRFRYLLDYKYVWGKIKRIVDKQPVSTRVRLVKGVSTNGDFTIDKNGSSSAVPDEQGRVDDRGLVLNEESDLNYNFLSMRDVPEIVYSLSAIDNICRRRGIKHVLVIPPVYEELSADRVNSIGNNVISQALQEFSVGSQATVIVDDRFNPRYTGKNSKPYYIHYDHPSSAYGRDLFDQI